MFHFDRIPNLNCIVQPRTPLTVQINIIAPEKTKTIRNALETLKEERATGPDRGPQRHPILFAPKTLIILFRGRRILGNCLGAFRHRMLGEFTGKNKPNTTVG